MGLSDDFKKTPRPTRGKAGAIRLRVHGARLGSAAYISELQSGRPETVVKVAGYLSGSKAVRQAIQYVGRLRDADEKDVRLEHSDGHTVEGKDEGNNLANAWGKGNGKDGAKKRRDAVHIIFSAGADLNHENIEKTRAAALAVARKHFSESGYDFILGMHQDGGYPHAHLIIKCEHRDAEIFRDLKKRGALPGDMKAPGKLRLGPADLLAIRRDFAQELTRQGLEHKATLRRDRPFELDRIRDGVASVKKSATYFERQLESVSPSYNAFLARKEIAARVVRIREHVKKNMRDKEEKKAVLSELRAVEASIKTVNMQRELPAALRRIEADLEKVVPGNRSIETSLERKRKDIDKGIDAARNAIASAKDLPLEEKRNALDRLREYELRIRQNVRGTKKDLDNQLPRFEERLQQLASTFAEKSEIQTKSERKDLKQRIDDCRNDPRCGEHHRQQLESFEQRLAALTVGPIHAKIRIAHSELETKAEKSGREIYAKVKDIAETVRDDLEKKPIEAIERRALGREMRDLMRDATRGYIKDVEEEIKQRFGEIHKQMEKAEQHTGGALPLFRQAMKLEQHMVESREFVTNLAKGLPLKEREALVQRMEALEKGARTRIEAGITHIEDRAATAGRDRSGYQARWEAQKCREIAGVPLAHTKTREIGRERER